ncbi:MAG: phosphopantetheine-binding protein [Lachnospiraceae bacterium]|nr:phosphopantetheine-binding protein [Lachnospiraceae bacterium]MDD3797063.1 phosphopantetheine-binding protein [Lachnospiraceae bacterium]
MERLMEILEEIQSGIDYENCKELVSGHHLSSLMIISLIAELEDEFDITIPAVEIVPANFNSAEAMWSMIQRLQEED